MCGRYVLALRPSEVRQQLEQAQMPVEHAPDDDEVRQTYNFAPGYHGLVYRAEGLEHDTSSAQEEQNEHSAKEDTRAGDTKYKLQAMKWGLVPFWTKRNPDYGSMMRTINCRGDSLIEDRGMWTTMKRRKRCIIIAQGFYEWLKKGGTKDKVPHFTKRKDGRLMCFAGLWDCVQFEDSDEKLYTYTVITTDSNKQLGFLHDRMPVILENGSEAIRTWLDPNRVEWSGDLQALLKPFDGELECYPVTKEVGKVGNNSPAFVVPVNSTANKQNIANFFGNQRKAAEEKPVAAVAIKTEHESNETRGTSEGGQEGESKAPSRGIKRERSSSQSQDGDTAAGGAQQRRRMAAAAKKQTRSATSNGSAAKTRAKGEGSRKITSFFTT